MGFHALRAVIRGILREGGGDVAAYAVKHFGEGNVYPFPIAYFVAPRADAQSIFKSESWKKNSFVVWRDKAALSDCVLRELDSDGVQDAIEDLEDHIRDDDDEEETRRDYDLAGSGPDPDLNAALRSSLAELRKFAASGAAQPKSKEGNRSAGLSQATAAAKSGDRLKLDDRVIWQGFGNRSGLHSYADELTSEKWQKSGRSLESKLKTAKGELQILRYKNITRDRGKWIVAKTFKI